MNKTYLKAIVTILMPVLVLMGLLLTGAGLEALFGGSTDAVFRLNLGSVLTVGGAVLWFLLTELENMKNGNLSE